MATLELQGRLYTLYLEGESEQETMALLFPDIKTETGRSRFVGFGRITDEADAKGELFPFETTYSKEGEQLFDSSLLLTPNFERIRGHTREAILRAMVRDIRPFIDALCASKLDWIDRWKSVELVRKGLAHRLLLPPTIVFGTLTPDILLAALGTRELPFPD